MRQICEGKCDECALVGTPRCGVRLQPRLKIVLNQPMSDGAARRPYQPAASRNDRARNSVLHDLRGVAKTARAAIPRYEF
jgi:hypothetical protein